MKQTIKPILDQCRVRIGGSAAEENPFD